MMHPADRVELCDRIEHGEFIWRGALASLCCALDQLDAPPAPEPDLVEQIAARVASLLGPTSNAPAPTEKTAPVLQLVPATRGGAILTLAEVAKLLSVSKPTVISEVEKHGLPATRVGKQWRFRRADVDRWIEQRRTNGRSSA